MLMTTPTRREANLRSTHTRYAERKKMAEALGFYKDGEPSFTRMDTAFKNAFGTQGPLGLITLIAEKASTSDPLFWHQVASLAGTRIGENDGKVQDLAPEPDSVRSTDD